MLGLQSLIAPLTVEAFLRDHHGRRAVLINGEPDKFGQMCGWSDISHLLNHGGLQYPNAKFVLNKEALPAESLQHADHWLREGATLIINAIQRLDPVIDHFTGALSRDLNAHVNVNCYTSWPSKQGFDNHFDRHDVFILQLDGTKRWSVFEPTQPYPLDQYKQSPGDPPETDPYLECTMDPGDVMYIPRGHWHYAIADTPSIHLTVGPGSRSGMDFLAWLMQNVLVHDELLRRDFPVVDNALLGGDRGEDVLLEHMRRFRTALQDALEDDALTGHFLRYCMTSNAIRRYCPLPDYVTVIEDWDRDTPFRVNPNQKALLRYDPGERHAVVLIRGHILNLEDIPEGLIEHLFHHKGTTSGGELKKAFPELKWSRLRKFLLRLFEVGVIQQAGDAP